MKGLAPQRISRLEFGCAVGKHGAAFSRARQLYPILVISRAEPEAIRLLGQDLAESCLFGAMTSKCRVIFAWLTHLCNSLSS